MPEMQLYLTINVPLCSTYSFLFTGVHCWCSTFGSCTSRKKETEITNLEAHDNIAELIVHLL